MRTTTFLSAARGRRRHGAWLLGALALALEPGCASQAPTVATLDLQRIQANWPKFINYSNQLASDSDAVNRSGASPRLKEQQIEALRGRYVSMQNEVTDDVRNAAEQVAAEKHLKLVVTRQFVGYGGIDITPDVERLLKITEKPRRSRSGVATLEEVAARVGGTVRGDATISIERISAIEDVDANSLTFATDERYLRAALRSRAAAVLTEPDIAERVGPARKPLLLVPSARVALAALLAALEPPRPRAPFRDPSAAVDPSATLGPDVHVGPLVSVGAGASVGAGTVLLAGAIVGAGARLGRECTLHPRAMLLDRCVAGDRCTLQAGAIVGSDGFGYVFVDGRFAKIPQIGDVVLGDDVEIGSNTCIDRAQTGTTAIGDGTKIDNLVQIGHNCRIGRHCGIVSMVGIAGSTTVGDYTVIGGQTGVNGHITIGSRAKIAGGTDVWSDLPDGAFVSGRPARDHREELKGQVRLRNLEKLYERVSALEQRK